MCSQLVVASVESQGERERERNVHKQATRPAFYSKVSELELHLGRLDRLRLRGRVAGTRTSSTAMAQIAFTAVLSLGRGTPEVADSLGGGGFGNGGGGGGRGAGGAGVFATVESAVGGVEGCRGRGGGVGLR